MFRAQFGEDRALWRLFRGQTTGYFVEVGAYDGVTLSNTWFLEQMGWTGLLVEPIPTMHERASIARPRSRVVHAACSRRGRGGSARFTIAHNVPVLSYLDADDEHVARCRREGAELLEVDVPVVTLSELLLRERESPHEGGGPWRANGGWRVDLVSIDTEGNELDVLDGFELERFKPRVLVIENDRPSGAAIEPYMASRGYRRLHRQTINDFYVRSEGDDGLDLDAWNGGAAEAS